MPNYALDFMQGYKFVNDINRQDKLDAENKADRERHYGLMDAAENRASTTFDQAQSDRQSQRDIAAAKAKAILGEPPPQQPAEIQQQAQPRDDVYSAWASNIEGLGVKTGTPEFTGALAKVKPLLDNPEATGTALAMSDEINRYMDKGVLPPNQLMAGYVNIVGAGELSQRGGDDGLTRRVKQFVPNQPGDGFHVNFLVQTPDGKQYEAPATEGKSADPKDNVVQNFTMDQMVKWYGGSRAALQMIVDAEAKAGRSDTIDAYRAAVQKYAADRQSRAENLKDYAIKKQIDQQYEKQPPVAIGRYGLYDPKTGQKIVGAAGGGLGETWTDENGDEHTVLGAGAMRAQARADKMASARIAAIGKVTEGGAKQIERLDSASPDPFIAELANGIMEQKVNLYGGDPRTLSGIQIGGESYRSAKKEYASALKIATGEAEQKRSNRGILEFDKTTFGGIPPEEWVANRAKEIALKAIEPVALPSSVGGATGSAVGTRAEMAALIQKKSWLNSPSPSLGLGQALGGLTRGMVGTAKKVPAVGDFVGEATAKTLYAIAPENVVKELLNQSKEFASWWGNASKEQRTAFLAKTNAERMGQSKPVNPADKYFR